MPSRNVTIIDYGVGNLLSVRRGFEFQGAKVTFATQPEEALEADRLVLPGVGAFGNAIEALKAQGLKQAVLEVVKKGRPLLAICLGMQLLLDESEEFGIHPGLCLIPGRVVPIPTETTRGERQKIPHIGWNELVLNDIGGDVPSQLFKGMQGHSSFYFVHSFMAQPAMGEHRWADCLYGGHRVAAIVGRDQVIGCQFHPEKSGMPGLHLIDNFLGI